MTQQGNSLLQQLYPSDSCAAQQTRRVQILMQAQWGRLNKLAEDKLAGNGRVVT